MYSETETSFLSISTVDLYLTVQNINCKILWRLWLTVLLSSRNLAFPLPLFFLLLSPFSALVFSILILSIVAFNFLKSVTDTKTKTIHFRYITYVHSVKRQVKNWNLTYM